MGSNEIISGEQGTMSISFRRSCWTTVLLVLIVMTSSLPKSNSGRSLLGYQPLRIHSRQRDPKSVISKPKVLPEDQVDSETRLRFGTLVNRSSFDMIITLCHEPLDRVLDFAHDLSIRFLYIYSKCGASSPDPKKYDIRNIVRYQTLPNVGREGDTWLTHMLRDDIQFADWNLFLQGGIEASLEKIFKARIAVENADNSSKRFDFLDLSQFFLRRPPEYIINCYRHIYSPCNPKIKYTQDVSKGRFRTKTPEICVFHDRYRFYESVTCEEAHISLRGEFLASGNLLKRVNSQHRHELEELKHLLRKSSNPTVGHLLERTWPSILGATDFSMMDSYA